MALTQGSEKMLLSFCQPQWVVLLGVAATSQVMSSSFLLVGPECVSCHGITCTGHKSKFKSKGNLNQNHKTMKKAAALLQKGRKQSEEGYVCS